MRIILFKNIFVIFFLSFCIYDCGDCGVGQLSDILYDEKIAKNSINSALRHFAKAAYVKQLIPKSKHLHIIEINLLR